MTLETPVVPATVGSDRDEDRAEARSWWRRHRLLVVIGGLVLLVVLFLLLRGKKGAAPAGAQRGGARVIAVVAVPAKLGDMSIYLDGLGTVTAINTVTVRSRVDGQLINVSYREGQLVHPGELLAQIDPRPFEVQLEQVQG